VVFGTKSYWSLLEEWYMAVRGVGTTYSELYYFPGQSLRGLLLRYFTPVAPPLKSFPLINILSLSPHTAVVIWAVISLALYCAFITYMLRWGARKLWIWDGLAFVLYSLLEPYAVKSGLISLGPAALTAAWLSTSRARQHQAATASRLFLAACALSFLGAVIQYRPWQRFLLTVGLDFWAEILLLWAFVTWVRAETAEA
jgi:hypothetical protein